MNVGKAANKTCIIESKSDHYKEQYLKSNTICSSQKLQHRFANNLYL
jgi:hypothetical protein